MLSQLIEIQSSASVRFCSWWKPNACSHSCIIVAWRVTHPGTRDMRWAPPIFPTYDEHLKTILWIVHGGLIKKVSQTISFVLSPYTILNLFRYLENWANIRSIRSVLLTRTKISDKSDVFSNVRWPSSATA